MLIWLFLVPFIASILIFFLPVWNKRGFKTLAVLLSLIPLGILIANYPNWMSDQINEPWAPTLGINFHLSVDALSLLFLFLLAIIVPIALLASSSDDLQHPNTFYGLVLLLQGLLVGFFTARDLVFFTIFYEAVIIPLYLIITLWGGNHRQNAGLKFLIYMVAGSAMLIVAVLALYFAGGSFDIDTLSKISEKLTYAPWLCAIFLVAFAVKTPLFPFHAWLPDAYTQAPTSGSILLSSLLSKAGIYGILRVVMELFPEQLRHWSPILLSMAIAGVFYGGFAAWMQKDFKRLVAYSSFSHVNFILAGLFIWERPAHAGAILQALNHGITIAGLFLVAGWLETRLKSTAMGKESGIAKFLPHLCWLTLFFVLSSVALPGLNNFIGELLILFGLFRQNPWVAAILSLSVILSVIYMLRWMQKVYFGAPTFFKEQWIDIKFKEFAIATPLILLILWIGIYPAPVLNLVKPAAEKILAASNLGSPK